MQNKKVIDPWAKYPPVEQGQENVDPLPGQCPHCGAQGKVYAFKQRRADKATKSKGGVATQMHNVLGCFVCWRVWDDRQP